VIMKAHATEGKSRANVGWCIAHSSEGKKSANRVFFTGGFGSCLAQPPGGQYLIVIEHSSEGKTSANRVAHLTEGKSCANVGTERNVRTGGEISQTFYVKL